MNKIQFIILHRKKKGLIPYSAESINYHIDYLRKQGHTTAYINQTLLDEYHLETEPIFIL